MSYWRAGRWILAGVLSGGAAAAQAPNELPLGIDCPSSCRAQVPVYCSQLQDLPVRATIEFRRRNFDQDSECLNYNTDLPADDVVENWRYCVTSRVSTRIRTRVVTPYSDHFQPDDRILASYYFRRSETSERRNPADLNLEPSVLYLIAGIQAPNGDVNVYIACPI